MRISAGLLQAIIFGGDVCIRAQVIAEGQMPHDLASLPDRQQRLREPQAALRV